MPGPGAHELLQAWESGLPRSPTNRALTLLATAMPGTPVEEIATLPIGARDVGLLRLRSALFGDRVEAVCSCPSCGEPLDVSFDLRDLLRDDNSEATDATASTRQLTLDGHQVTVRAPSSLDLLAVAGEPDLLAARRALLRRCLAVAGDSGAPSADSLPDDVAEALGTQIAALDPRARIELDLGCAACGHNWRTVFDIAGFLWAEIDAWAPRILRDVHTLARAYGWREADILAMSARRRQSYLELAWS
jgi:hypothetical protein